MEKQDVLRMLIVEINPWFAFVVGACAIGLGVLIATWMAVKPNRMSHEETMRRQEFIHKEAMANAHVALTKVQRDTPKLADGSPAKVIENQQNVGHSNNRDA